VGLSARDVAADAGLQVFIGPNGAGNGEAGCEQTQDRGEEG
jgi:hypothetical protein